MDAAVLSELDALWKGMSDVLTEARGSAYANDDGLVRVASLQHLVVYFMSYYQEGLFEKTDPSVDDPSDFYKAFTDILKSVHNSNRWRQAWVQDQVYEWWKRARSVAWKMKGPLTAVSQESPQQSQGQSDNKTMI